ncbi:MULTISPECIES: hypothetical protein [Nostoc]|uniref:Uncharacterized protein n=1 Tax=Nostoc paludosum FACHB-159 TaxID=2692908 RepID=A0ABR8KKP3_9NOSO|nr:MULTISPECIES: hypothetical protein [Nostoc]MBD2739391.1 hypothetical protein [Nostoc paludosum FACHB-159]
MKQKAHDGQYTALCISYVMSTPITQAIAEISNQPLLLLSHHQINR